MAEKTAISPTRSADYPEWYQQVIRAAELAETSVVRGCMVIRPWGWGIWEGIQRELDSMIKETGHENAYFPLFIPVSFLEKEAEHVEGFAKECAVVTHHRLEHRDGKLVPTGELEEPLVVRPTSETIIGESFSRRVKSYRDLPLLINQWANVVRWEMRPRIFLRTTEFLWQEGHTVHATEEDARAEVMQILEIYRHLAEDILAIPVIKGEKSENERFPGAVNSMCIEAMMQDRKALQAGTSHYLGQNFARASEIRFLNDKGELQHAFTTSWGVSTRLIGGMIMTHGDDNGLRVPPRVTPKHAVVLPVIPSPEAQASVLEYAHSIAAELSDASFHGVPVRVHLDDRDIRGGEKNWQWVKKGIPLRIEVGPRDIASNQVVVYRRDAAPNVKVSMSREELCKTLPSMLDGIQANYFEEARRLRDENIRTDLRDYEEFRQFFTPRDAAKPEIHGGFVRAKWCSDIASTALLDPLKVTIRCLPLDQSSSEGKCILTGKPATLDAIFAKAY
jgi:prolyl-tRNA synthetase